MSCCVCVGCMVTTGNASLSIVCVGGWGGGLSSRMRCMMTTGNV